MHQQLKWPAII